jgi:hypothetical protein
METAWISDNYCIKFLVNSRNSLLTQIQSSIRRTSHAGNHYDLAEFLIKDCGVDVEATIAGQLLAGRKMGLNGSRRIREGKNWNGKRGPAIYRRNEMPEAEILGKGNPKVGTGDNFKVLV